MTLNEFKAWLEGFEEAMGGNPPSADQWASIKAKLAKVSDSSKVTFREPAPKDWPSRTWLHTTPLVARYR